MTRYNANLSREHLMSINTTKRQHKITISFDQQDDDLYYELTRQSTRNMLPISKLSRHWMRGGMNLQTNKQPAVVWVMKKNVPISVLAYEMLQELAKKSRPSAKPEVWMENHIKDQYNKLKWESYMTHSTFNEDSGEGKGKKKKSSKTDTIRRMLRSYKERKRKEKIAKLMSRDDHWKGLS